MKIVKRLYRLWLSYRHNKYVNASMLFDLLNSDGGDNHKAMVRVRTLEAQIKGPSRVTIGGDSIIHNGEPFFEEVGAVVAIGGMTTQKYFNSMKDIVLSRKPEIAVIDIGGNDLLRGDKPTDIIQRIDAIVEQHRRAGTKHVVFFDFPPLDIHADVKPEQREKILYAHSMMPKLSALMKERGYNIIAVRSALAGNDGWVRSLFAAGDGIHLTGNAYTLVYVPMLKSYLRDKL